MQTDILFYIVIALFLSVSLAFFQYFYRVKEKNKTTNLLFSLRSLSIFLLFIMLINPSLEKSILTNQKPILSVLVDNSISTAYFKQEVITKNLLADFKTNSLLYKKFDIAFYSFGNSLNVLDSLSFDKSQTNIYNALQGVEELNKGAVSPIVLISDGNQTEGKLYDYFKSNKNIYPIIIGDTVDYADVKIEQLNVNKYSYLNNQFPVECRILYEGKEDISSEFKLFYKGKTIYKKKLFFTEEKNVQTITTNIKSIEKGVQYYMANIQNLKDEKNTQNNQKTFSVEVLDEQTKVLILTDIFHPDLGALKKSIETNKQRSVTIKNVTNKNIKIDDFQLVILYQPNKNFKLSFRKIKKKNVPYFIITGTQTNWSFLNEEVPLFSKNSIDQVEDYGADFNAGFLAFAQKNLAFHTFPPLKDVFGTISLNEKHDILLYQNISGIKTNKPLLVFFDDENQKFAALFGENIWKWRAASFLSTNSFQDFDEFIANLVQYVSSNKKRERLSVVYENIYAANESISIRAYYLDKNYRFDTRSTLNLKLTNTDSKVSQNIPFSLKSNSFEATLNDFVVGNYNFIIQVNNQEISKRGAFKITDYQIERQFASANKKKLSRLALKTGGEIFNANENNILIKKILNDKRYFTTQKEVVIKKQLIEWEFVLFIIVFLLSVEWFIRKYYGKI